MVKPQMSARVYDGKLETLKLQHQNREVPQPIHEFIRGTSSDKIAAWVLEHTSQTNRQKLGVDLDKAVRVGDYILTFGSLSGLAAFVNVLSPISISVDRTQASHIVTRVKCKVDVVSFVRLHEAYRNQKVDVPSGERKNLLIWQLLDSYFLSVAEAVPYKPSFHRLSDYTPTPLNYAVMSILNPHHWNNKDKKHGAKAQYSARTLKSIEKRILGDPAAMRYLEHLGLLSVWRMDFKDWSLARFLVAVAAFCPGMDYCAYKSFTFPINSADVKGTPWFGREVFRRDFLPKKGETGGFARSKVEIKRLLPRLKTIFTSQPARPDVLKIIKAARARGERWWEPRYLTGVADCMDLLSISQEVRQSPPPAKDARPLESNSQEVRQSLPPAKDARPLDSNSQEVRQSPPPAIDARPLESNSQEVRQAIPPANDARPLESNSQEVR